MPQKDKERIMNRAESEVTAILPQIRTILDDIKKGGNRSVLEYMERFDKVTFTPETMRVTQKEIQEAYKKVSPDLLESLKTLYRQVQKFHDLQRPNDWFTELSPGLIAGQTIIPLETVGCYTPAGRGWFPSTVFMNACPARSAGVKKIVMCCPPEKDGSMNPGALVAMDLVGVDEIYKLAGAQAIAAMGFGTETISECDVVVGPGSAWVVGAKMILRECGKSIGVVAGPGECLVLADETANPLYVASDMIIQTEHGYDSAGVLVAPSMDFAKEVQQNVNTFVDELPDYRKDFSIVSLKKYGAIIVVDSLDEGIEFVNDYVVEHLEVCTKDPLQTMKRIKNTGAFYLGNYAPMSAGCFCSGPNHVLPTAKYGRIRGGLNTEDFFKRVTFEYPSKEGLARLEKAMTTLSDYETFYAHGNAIRRRFPELYDYDSEKKQYERKGK